MHDHACHHNFLITNLISYFLIIHDTGCNNLIEYTGQGLKNTSSKIIKDIVAIFLNSVLCTILEIFNMFKFTIIFSGNISLDNVFYYLIAE